MQNNSQKIGKEGEEMAKAYLKKMGFTILQTNWRYKKLEVDIIACNSEFIVFVEVKARSSNAFGEPEVFVTKKKQKFLIAAAHQYLLEYEIEKEARFDIIALTGAIDNPKVKHLPGAFYPSL